MFRSDQIIKIKGIIIKQGRILVHKINFNKYQEVLSHQNKI